MRADAALTTRSTGKVFSKKKFAKRALFYSALIVLSVIFMLPFIVLLNTSLMTIEQIVNHPNDFFRGFR